MTTQTSKRLLIWLIQVIDDLKISKEVSIIKEFKGGEAEAIKTLEYFL